MRSQPIARPESSHPLAWETAVRSPMASPTPTGTAHSLKPCMIEESIILPLIESSSLSYFSPIAPRDQGWMLAMEA